MSEWSSWIFTDESQLYGVTFPTKLRAMYLILIWILHSKKKIKKSEQIFKGKLLSFKEHNL